MHHDMDRNHLAVAPASDTRRAADDLEIGSVEVQHAHQPAALEPVIFSHVTLARDPYRASRTVENIGRGRSAPGMAPGAETPAEHHKNVGIHEIGVATDRRGRRPKEHAL
jgi:hypothetical protein